MKPEMYNVCATKSYLGDKGPEFDSTVFKVLAFGHEQHSPNSTRLMDVSKSGLKKIREMREGGYMISVDVGGRSVGVEN